MVYLYVSRPCRSDRQVINGLVITRLHAAKRSVSCSLVNAVQLHCCNTLVWGVSAG